MAVLCEVAKMNLEHIQQEALCCHTTSRQGCPNQLAYNNFHICVTTLKAYDTALLFQQIDEDEKCWWHHLWWADVWFDIFPPWKWNQVREKRDKREHKFEAAHEMSHTVSSVSTRRLTLDTLTFALSDVSRSTGASVWYRIITPRRLLPLREKSINLDITTVLSRLTGWWSASARGHNYIRLHKVYLEPIYIYDYKTIFS